MKKMVEYFGITLDEDKLPVHIGIILDGNRRWARARGLPPMEGHRKGIENLERIVKFVKKIGVKILSVYAFSTENWKRSPEEINFLMDIVDKYFRDNLKDFKEKGIRVVHSGRKNKLPFPTKRAILTAVRQTKNNNEFIFNICFNYGGRQEIIDGIKKLFLEVSKNRFNIKKLNEKNFSMFLYNPELPEPDLIIRTSGEVRTSNFLLWESAYSEWYFTKTYWPDFNEKELVKAIKDYQQRERRFGK